MIELTIYGTPAPQGSKKFVGIKNGHGMMVESSKKVKPWREAVKWAFLSGKTGTERPAVPGPVAVQMVFTLPKPKSAKKNAVPDKKPDLSKLIRSTEDALTEVGAWEDDARVVRLDVTKLYVGAMGALPSPGATIRILEY